MKREILEKEKASRVSLLVAVLAFLTLGSVIAIVASGGGYEVTEFFVGLLGNIGEGGGYVLRFLTTPFQPGFSNAEGGGYSANIGSFSSIDDFDESPNVILVSPIDNYVNSSEIVNLTFECSMTDSVGLVNISLYITNNSNTDFSLNQTTNVSGTINSTSWTLELGDGSYTWNCFGFDTGGNSDWGDSNWTLEINYSLEIFNISATLISSSEAVIIWQTDNSTNSTVYYGTTIPLGLSFYSSTLTTSHLVRLSGLSSNTLYYYNVSSCDSVGNCNTSAQFNFTTLAPSVSVSGETSGGGGVGVLSSIQRTLSKGSRIVFRLDKEIHYLKIIDIDNTSVTIEISSTPQQAVLNIGEEKKFEINDDDYYDIFVRLNGIKNNMANITLDYIHEEISIQLFDISFNLVDKSIESISELVAVVTFENFGTIPTPVNLLFTILDENGNEVYTEEDQIIVETEEVLRKSFENISLEKGKYTFILTTLYNIDVVDEFRQEFEIKRETGLANYVKRNLIIIFSLILIVFVIFYLIKIKRNKNEKTEILRKLIKRIN